MLMFFDNSTSGLWQSDFLKVETPAPWHLESCIEDQTFVSWKLRPWGAVRQTYRHTDREKDFMLFRCLYFLSTDLFLFIIICMYLLFFFRVKHSQSLLSQNWKQWVSMCADVTTLHLLDHSLIMGWKGFLFTF